LATPSVTALIDRLEAKGLLRRVRGRQDRRRVMVELTPALKKEVAPLFGPLGRRMLLRFERYSAREIELIRDLLLRRADERREESGNARRRSPPFTRQRAPAARPRAYEPSPSSRTRPTPRAASASRARRCTGSSSDSARGGQARGVQPRDGMAVGG